MSTPSRSSAALCALVLTLFAARSGDAAIVGLERVASGLSGPMVVTHAPGDTSRLFIAERGAPNNNSNATASIRILDLATGQLNATPFLSISGINNSGEGGLLGMAFHPNYQENGKFYVHLTANNSISGSPFSSYIREYTVSTNPDVAGTSFRPILDIAQPQTNHNGGWIGFSPNDNYLYIASGDGGGSNDTGTGHTAGTGNAQDLTNNWLGKMLRVDVDGDDFPADTARNYAVPSSNPFVGQAGDDEIWSYGLRNPFRASFDRATGDLWIGDVGQGAREEINFQPGDSPGGENYGWRLREGQIQTPGSVGGDKPADNVDPVYDYNRDNDEFGGTVVTGGYVYRGPDPSLQGQYIFLDSRSSPSPSDDNYWMFDPADPYGTVTNINSLLWPDVGAPQFPVSMGEDANGNLYIAYMVSGEIYRIATDELRPGDFNGDGNVDGADFVVWQTNFPNNSGDATRAMGDANGDGNVDGADFVVWQTNFPTTAGGAPVPEPAAAILALLAAPWWMGRRMGRRPIR